MKPEINPTPTTGNTVSAFRVYHRSMFLGAARLTGNQCRYATDAQAFSYFEAMDTEWLSEFRAVVLRLCRSVGHSSAYSISEDQDSGIRVERV